MMNSYLNVLRKGLKNPSDVFEGWLKSALNSVELLNEQEAQEAKVRLEICHTCPFNSENAEKNLNYKTDLNYLHCSSCKCPLEKKVFVKDGHCGLAWFLNHPGDEDQSHILEYYRNNLNETPNLKW